jgi:putative hydrolase of the HAD superfamily
MKYKAVVFDLFGTLVDNFPPGAFDRVVTEMANLVGITPSLLIQRWGEVFAERDIGTPGPVACSVEQVCRNLGAEASAAGIQAAAQKWVDLIRCILTPRKDAAESMALLRGRGYKIGLISNCGWEVPELWEATPVAPLFDIRVYSCAVGLTKPSPRIYQLVCEQLEVRPDECVYVGDGSDGELTGAAQVGMRPVLISVPYEPADDLYFRYHPDALGWQGLTLRSLKGIVPLLDE